MLPESAQMESDPPRPPSIIITVGLSTVLAGS